MDLLDNFVIRDKEGFNHAKEISKPFGGLEEIIIWCKSELVEDWRWQMVEMSLNTKCRYIFYFDSERDYLAFIMKWA